MAGKSDDDRVVVRDKNDQLQTNQETERIARNQGTFEGNINIPGDYNVTHINCNVFYPSNDTAGDTDITMPSLTSLSIPGTSEKRKFSLMDTSDKENKITMAEKPDDDRVFVGDKNDQLQTNQETGTYEGNIDRCGDNNCTPTPNDTGSFNKYRILKVTISRLLQKAHVKEMCTLFCDSNKAEEERILSNECPGLCLFDVLESKNELGPHNVAKLKNCLNQLSLNHASIIVQQYQIEAGNTPPLTSSSMSSTSENRKHPLMDISVEENKPKQSGDLSNSETEKQEEFIEDLRYKYGNLYAAVQPIPFLHDRIDCVNKVFVESEILLMKENKGFDKMEHWTKLE